MVTSDRYVVASVGRRKAKMEPDRCASSAMNTNQWNVCKPRMALDAIQWTLDAISFIKHSPRSRLIHLTDPAPTLASTLFVSAHLFSQEGIAGLYLVVALENLMRTLYMNRTSWKLSAEHGLARVPKSCSLG